MASAAQLCMVVMEEGKTAVTTEGDEVVVTLGLVALQTGGHVVRVVDWVDGGYGTSGWVVSHPSAMRLRLDGARWGSGFATKGMGGPPAHLPYPSSLRVLFNEIMKRCLDPM